MKRHARSLVRVLADHLGSRMTGVEVGVSSGELSESLLRTFPHLILYMVDGWELLDENPTQTKSGKTRMEEERLAATSRTGFAGRRRTIVQCKSLDAATRFVDGQLDFVFVDACHLYESVRDDVSAWAPKIRRGGVLSGHDYDGMGDRRKGWGVRRAVDEWASENRKVVSVEPGRVWWIEM